jgi:hypothetical protein
MGIVCTKLSNRQVADPTCMLKIEDERILSFDRDPCEICFTFHRASKIYGIIWRF